MAGAGFSRVGLDPAGLRSADRSLAPVPQARARGRAIDPKRHDYVKNATMPIVSQKVLIALGNKVGSFSWDLSKGDASLTIPKDNGKMLATVTAYTRAQLAEMVAAGEVEIVAIRVDVVQGAYSREVDYRDVSTGQQSTATAGL